MAFVLSQELWENDDVRENEARGDKLLTVSGRWRLENGRAFPLPHAEGEGVAASNTVGG